MDQVKDREGATGARVHERRDNRCGDRSVRAGGRAQAGRDCRAFVQQGRAARAPYQVFEAAFPARQIPAHDKRPARHCHLHYGPWPHCDRHGHGRSHKGPRQLE